MGRAYWKCKKLLPLVYGCMPFYIHSFSKFKGLNNDQLYGTHSLLTNLSGFDEMILFQLSLKLYNGDSINIPM